LNIIVTLKCGLEVTEGNTLKVVPFESLGTVSYSPSIVTMAISAAILEIFSLKNGLTLKSGFGVRQGH